MIRELKGKKPQIHPTAYIDSTAEIIGEVTIGENSSIWPGTVLRGDMHYIKIGKNVSVQDNAVIHGTEMLNPAIVGDNVSIGHSAIVHGCKVGSNCIIGMGSMILDGAEVGDWCIIGAGAVVTEGTRIPSGSIVMGVPAKVVKNVDEKHKERITKNWQNYIKLKNEYLKSKSRK